MQEKNYPYRSEVDDVIESAIEWQVRARQNHGVTLGIDQCIKYALSFASASAMSDISRELKTLVALAGK